MINVLMCANSFPPATGGIATYAFQIASNLHSIKGFNVKVIAPHMPGCDMTDSKLSFQIYRYKSKINLYIKLLLFTLATDIIFMVQRGGFATFAYWINIFKKTPYVVAAHGLESNSKKFNKIVRNLNSAARVTPVSHYTANFFESIGVKKDLLEVIHNGAVILPDGDLDIKSRYGLKNKDILLTVGRLITHKGHDNVIEALPRIVKKVPNIHYLIVGDGPDRKKLEEKVKAQNVSQFVTFTGYVTEAEIGAYSHI